MKCGTRIQITRCIFHRPTLAKKTVPSQSQGTAQLGSWASQKPHFSPTTLSPRGLSGPWYRDPGHRAAVRRSLKYLAGL